MSKKSSKSSQPPQQALAGGAGAEGPNSSAAPQKPKRKRKWFKRLLWLGGGSSTLFIALLAAIPFIIAIPMVRDYALSFVNAQLRGTLKADSVNVSWMGPVELKGVSLDDADARRVFAVQRLKCERSLWDLLTRGITELPSGKLNLGEVIVEQPTIDLIVNEKNEISLVDALQPKAAAAPPSGPSAAAPTPSKGGGLPEPTLDLLVKDAKISARRVDGANYAIDDIQLSVKVRTLNEMVTKLEGKLPNGTLLSTDVDLRDLALESKIAIDKAKAKVGLRSNGDVDLAPIMAVFMPKLGLSGAATLKIDADMQPGQALAATFDLAVKQLQTAAAGSETGNGGPAIAPLNVTLTGSAAQAGDAITASASLASEAGKLDVGAKTTRAALEGAGSTTIDTEKLLAILQKGGVFTLPQGELTASGNVDLAKLQRALPGIFKMPAGKSLDAGSVQLTDVKLSGGEAPAAAGKVALRDIAATVDGKAVKLQPIDANVAAAFEPSAGLRIDAADLTSAFANLKAKGRLSDANATFDADLAKLKAELGQLIDLTALDATGLIAGTLTAKGDNPENVALQLSADAKELRVGANSQPTNLTLNADASRKADDLKLDAKLGGDAGTVEAQLASTLSALTKKIEPAIDAERVLSAVLSGESLNLPQLTLTAKGGLDVARLQRAMPSLFPVRQGQTLTSGRLEISDLALQTGESPSVKGAIGLRDVSASDNGKTLTLKPIDLTLDASLQKGSGLKVETAKLTAVFAEVLASGTTAALSAKFRGDLAGLRQELGQIVDFGLLDMGGQVDGELTMKRSADDALAVDLNANATALKVNQGSNQFSLQQARLEQRGTAKLEGQSLQRYELTSAKVSADGQIEAQGAGWYDLKSQGFDASVTIDRADLSFAAARAAALQAPELARYAGVVSGKATAQRGGAGQSLRSTGGLVTRDLKVDGKSVVPGELKADWQNVEISGDFSQIKAELAKVDSAIAKLQASGVDLTTPKSGPLALRADVTANADVEKTLGAVAAITKMAAPPAIAGMLALQSKLSTDGDDVSFSGTSKVDNFAIGSGESAIREPQVALDFDGRIGNSSEQIALNRAKLTSGLLSAEASGNVSKFRSSPNLAIKGRYDTDWKSLSRLIYEFVPAIEKTVTIEGRNGATFELNGPLNTPGATPAFRGLAAGTELGWEKASVYAIPLGAAKFQPSLRDGRLTLPVATVPASTGKLNLGGVVDFTPGEPTLLIEGDLPVMQHIELTPRIGAELLSFINPIFSGVTRLEGFLDMNVSGITLPMGQTMKTGGAGQGRLDLGSVKMSPGGPMIGELVQLAGLSATDLVLVQFSPVDFKIGNGRLSYDNFTMTFPENFDLKFYGSVGFDSTLDLVMSVPVRPALLQRLGVPPATLAMVKKTSGLRVDIPVAGTRESPKLDLSKIDVTKLVAELLLPDSPTDAIGDILRRASGGKPADGAKPGAETPGRPSGGAKPADKPANPIDDVLKRIPGQEPRKPSQRPAGRPGNRPRPNRGG
ncbi:MAG: hypothetical protein SF069_17805 [Phycisphaerae bacterium]|nr:hypothetical protein [Phycisphaerae bacterium]